MASKKTVTNISLVALGIFVFAVVLICGLTIFGTSSFDAEDARARCESAGGYWDDYDWDCEL